MQTVVSIFGTEVIYSGEVLQYILNIRTHASIDLLLQPLAAFRWQDAAVLPLDLVGLCHYLVNQGVCFGLPTSAMCQD